MNMVTRMMSAVTVNEYLRNRNKDFRQFRGCFLMKVLQYESAETIRRIEGVQIRAKNPMTAAVLCGWSDDKIGGSPSLTARCGIGSIIFIDSKEVEGYETVILNGVTYKVGWNHAIEFAIAA